jgi:hypothetical protein
MRGLVRISAALVLGGAFSAAAADSAATDGKTLYKWTDGNGRAHYSDRVPPEAASQERDQIVRGKLRQVLPRQQTPEELAEQEHQLKQAQQQAAYDRSLLQSYQSVSEIQATRNERLHALDERLQLLQKAVDDAGARLAELRAQDTAVTAAEDAAGLHRQIESYQLAYHQSLDVATRLRTERDAVAMQFERDIRRYQQLRAGSMASDRGRPRAV